MFRQLCSDIHAIAVNLLRIAKAIEDSNKRSPNIFIPSPIAGGELNTTKFYPSDPKGTITVNKARENYGFPRVIRNGSAKPDDNYEI